MTPIGLRVQPCADRQLEENLTRGVFHFHWGVRLRMTPEKAAEVARKIAGVDELRKLVQRYMYFILNKN